MAGNEHHADIRAALIAAARGQIGREDGSLFSVESLCAEVGIGQEEFGRFFLNKEALIAAALNEDVAQLKEIAISAAEPRVALAVANGPSVSAPAADAWLERRLRVFERALTALEARQEKSEQVLNRSVALLEEKIERPADKLDIPIAAPMPERAKQVQPFKGQPAKTEIVATVAERPRPVPKPDQPPPVAPKEMEDLLANARRVAREAVAIEPPPKPRTVPRWMIWTAACCVLLMGTAALLLNTVAGASVRPDSISRRQVVPPSLARVITLADSGDARSQTLLALAYLHGQNVTADSAAALRWGLAAAKQGEPMAQYLVGTFYQDGSAVAADPHRAFGWFEAAALRGNLKAMHDLAIAYVEGRGTPHNSARAAAWFNRAAGQGYVDSQFDLAVLYERGDGVRQNPKAALKWYLIAAEAGDNQARERANQLASEMAAEDVTQVRTLAARFTPAPRDAVANAL